MDLVWRRRIRLTSAFIFSFVLAAVFAGCTSANTNVTAPSGSKCAVTASSSMSSAPSAGAEATVNVNTTQDCTWSASTATSWITLGAPTSGQGSGSIDVRIAANPAPVARDGAVAVNGQDVSISQLAAPCTFSVAPANAAINSTGGSVTVQVGTLNGCSWTSSSGALWLAVSGGANGPASATITASVNTGAARSGTVTIAGQAVAVEQAATPTPAPTPAPTCNYTLSPTSSASSALAAVVSVAVGTGSGCAWTAKSNTSWITVSSGESGTGPGTVMLAIAINAGAARSGSVTIAGQAFNVSQDAVIPSCSYTISPTKATLSAQAGSGSVTVTAGSGCAWTATSPDAWIAITAGASGTANGTVKYTVTANGTKDRDGTIAIANQTFAVTQSGATH